MKATTIDRLDFKDHVRWASDQDLLDPSFIAESALVAPHPEVMGVCCMYPSQFDTLFELQKQNQPWANFTPPPQLYRSRRRPFSSTLFSLAEEEDHPLKERLGQEKKERPFFEEDKGRLYAALDSIYWIASLLKLIQGRKLQYQKG